MRLAASAHIALARRRRRSPTAPHRRGSSWLTWARSLRRRRGAVRCGWRAMARVLRTSATAGASQPAIGTAVHSAPNWRLTLRPRFTLLSPTVVRTAVVRSAVVRSAAAPSAPSVTARGAAARSASSSTIPQSTSLRTGILPRSRSWSRTFATTWLRREPRSLETPSPSGRGRPSRSLRAPRVALPGPQRTGRGRPPADGSIEVSGSRRFLRVEDSTLTRGLRAIKTRSVATAQGSPPQAPAPAVPASVHPSSTRQLASAPATPQLDVNTLADQVLRRLDRRVTAWRERTGRV